MQHIIGVDLNTQTSPVFALVAFAVIGILGLWIWMIIDFIKRVELKQLRYRVLWGCMLILTSVVGGIIYFIFIYSHRKKKYLDTENYENIQKTNSQFIYAGFWERVLAFLIDIIIVIIFLEIMERILRSSGYSAGKSLAIRDNALRNFAILTFYFTIMEISKWQGTVGKIMLNVKVTDENGNKVTFIKSLIRNVSKLLSATALNMGFFMIAFTSRRQGLHDMIAHCLVVRKTITVCPISPPVKPSKNDNQ